MAEQANDRVTRRSPGRRRRAAVWALALFVLGTMALPMTGYIAPAVDTVQAADDKKADEDTNPRAEYWRAVRGGQEGYSAVSGQETNVLIQNGGQNWRQVRQGPVTTYGAIAMGVVILLLVIFHVAFGAAKLEQRTGNKILRWPMIDRVLHWYTAILFIILALTGLSLLYGRAVLIPVMGKEGFAAWAAIAKPIHDYLSLFFSAGLLLLLLIWIKQNIPSGADLQWILKGGGYFSKQHMPSGYVNGGEKVWYWVLFFGSVALVGSGVFLLFPNMGWDRATMQLANTVHGISSLVLMCFVLGHIYLGTVGNEGTLEGMVSGEVDEGWAKQHHGLWYDEVKGTRSADVSGGAARPSPAAPEK